MQGVFMAALSVFAHQLIKQGAERDSMDKHESTSGDDPAPQI
jgi:hypothetical protein